MKRRESACAQGNETKKPNNEKKKTKQKKHKESCRMEGDNESKRQTKKYTIFIQEKHEKSNQQQQQ